MDRKKMLAEMYSQIGKEVADKKLEEAKPLVKEDSPEKRYIKMLEQKILELQRDHRILKSNQLTLQNKIAQLHEKIKRSS